MLPAERIPKASDLDQKARWSWVLVDFGNSAFSTTIAAAIFPVYLPTLLPKDGISFQIGSFVWKSSALSLWGYTVSFSFLLMFLVTPLLGAWADRGGYRKFLFGFFTLIGALASSTLGFFEHWQGALIAFVIANMGFSGSCIFYNSLLQVAAPKRLWHKVSLEGFAWGYIGGGLLLAANLVMIMKYSWFGLVDKQAGLRWSFASVGIWWAIFSIPALIFLEEKKTESLSKAFKHAGTQAREAFRELFRTIRSLPAYPALLIFMLAYALFNDGIQTVISMATLYGKEALGLSENDLIGTLLLIQFLGLPFTLLSAKFTQRWGAKQVLVSSLWFWIGILIYAYFMKNGLDFWILGVLVSVVLGVSQSLPRSIFAKLIPEEKQAEFFSFFALSGKMTAVLGPLVFSLVRDLTGDARASIVAMGVFFLIGVTLLRFVPIDKARD